MSKTIVNNKAFKPTPGSKVITLEVQVLLDDVPGPYHKPKDVMRWIASHSYVQSVTLKGE